MQILEISILVILVASCLAAAYFFLALPLIERSGSREWKYFYYAPNMPEGELGVREIDYSTFEEALRHALEDLGSEYNVPFQIVYRDKMVISKGAIEEIARQTSVGG